MKHLQKLKCLNALELKLLAMALMLCDHLWATIVPGSQWLTDLGRLAFPIFAFQIAEGWAMTHDRKKYARRMFLFALLSEIPFNLMYGGSVIYPFHQNVLFTFCLALWLLSLLEKIKTRRRWLAVFLAVLVWLLGYLLGILTMVDYFGVGVLTVLLFYFTRDGKFGWLIQLIGLWYFNGKLLAGLVFPITLLGRTFEFPQQALAVLALIPIWLYNGKQGPHSRAVQYACYAFYPVHMLILSVLWLYVL